MNRWTKHLAGALALAAPVTLGACAETGPTDELVAARTAMQSAQGGEAARFEPEELRQAELALQRAEQAHEEAPGSQVEADYAYVAERKILTVSARARRTATEQELAAEQRQYTEALEAANRSRQDQLRQTDEQLSRVREDLQQRGDVIDEQTRALREREAALMAQREELGQVREERDQAQARLAEAMQALEEFAELRQDQEELVITLNGSVLFESDQSTLMTAAEQRLQAVARALQGREGSTFVVEGHTDSRASDAHNQQLSQARAQTVRDYLVTQGVQAGTITAVGRGESQPVASNDNAEGRANNRRVEIHVRGEDMRQSRR